MSRYVIIHDSMRQPQVYDRRPIGDRIEYIPVEADVIIPSRDRSFGIAKVVAVLFGFFLGFLKDTVIDSIKDLAKPIGAAVLRWFTG